VDGVNKMVNPFLALFLAGLSGLVTLFVVMRQNTASKAINAMAAVTALAVIGWAFASTTWLGPAVGIGAATWAWFLTMPNGSKKFLQKICLMLGQIPFVMMADYPNFALGQHMSLFLLVLLDLFLVTMAFFAPKKLS